MPYFSDRKIAIKSVPPLVALANRHRLMASALISPPKIAISRISSVLFLLALAGLTAGGVLFNLLDARAGTIFPSWAVHIFANLAINTVGFILFKIL